MKKVISLFLLLFMLPCFGVQSYAGTSMSWYIIRNGNEIPDFPEDAAFIEEHNGFFLDKKCSINGEKKIYLTFDAGYENGNVSKILDILYDENVTGAFFILNNLMNKNPEIVIRMANEGHLVCNHTSNHKDMTKLTEQEMISNLKRAEDRYRECTGLEMAKIFRFPEGKYNKDTILTCYNAGYKTVFWSMAYDDWDNSVAHNPSDVIDKLISTTHNGAIVLLHPTSEINVKILPDLIKEWKNMGFEFGTLDDL